VIYVDVSSAVHSKAGLARYCESLVNALRPLLDGQLRLFQNSLGSKGPLRGWENHQPAGVRLGYKPWRGLVALAECLRWPMDGLFPSDAILYHATEHLLPPLHRIRTVLTVHDLVFERFPQYHRKKNYYYLRMMMPRFCQRADHIIAVSRASQVDLVNFYRIPREKITVIPEAAAPIFAPCKPAVVDRVRKRYGLPQRYLLSVGTIEPRKNLGRLLDACVPILRRGLADALVIVGSKGWLYEGFFAHLASYPLREQVILPGYIADQDLPALYSGAIVTVQASLWEGFGLPVLEAMACGSPVCASHVSSLPEVGGDAAAYFDPHDTGDITRCLEEILVDDARREAMRAKSLARAAEFSWQRTASETLDVYHKVIGDAVIPSDQYPEKGVENGDTRIS